MAIPVRQPLPSLTVFNWEPDKKYKKAIEKLIKDEVNVKKVFWKMISQDQQERKKIKKIRSGLRKCLGHRIHPGNRYTRDWYKTDVWNEDGQCGICGGFKNDSTRGI